MKRCLAQDVLRGDHGLAWIRQFFKIEICTNLHYSVQGSDLAAVLLLMPNEAM